MEEVGLVGVLVLIYIDNVLIVRRGWAWVGEQARRVVEALSDAGGVISPKSTLELVIHLVWLGKDVDLGGGSPRMAGNALEAMLAHLLRLSVGSCSVRRLHQFLGCWLCRPGFGHCPHLSGVWAHVWALPGCRSANGTLIAHHHPPPPLRAIGGTTGSGGAKRAA